MTEEKGQERPEAFGAAAFVLTANMLRELVADGVVTRERAVSILEGSISTLRRLYSAVPKSGLSMVERDTFDLDVLINAAHEEEAERLLRAILDGLRR
jgi:hypothetical protein